MATHINPATQRVSSEQWADYCSNFRCYCTEARDDLMLVRLRTSRNVIGMVRYRPDGTKTYAIRPGAHHRFPEDAIRHVAVRHQEAT